MAQLGKHSHGAAVAERTGLDDLIMVRVIRIADMFDRLAQLTIGRKWNLSNTDLRLLNVLDRANSLSIREIGRRIHVDKAWVSRSIGALEQRKLVRRQTDQSDLRRILVSLTKQGQRILDEVRPFALERESLLLKNTDGDQLKQWLDRIEHNAGAMLEQQDPSDRR